MVAPRERIQKVFKGARKHLIGLALTAGSVAVILVFHRLSLFDNLELKVIDFGHRVRGPLSGWAARQEIPKDSLDVVVVEVDDESYRLVPWTWPYPRSVWAQVLDHLSRAGAKVVVFDIQFDAPDRRSEYLKDIGSELRSRGIHGLVPTHGDSVLASAIRQVEENGTAVIMASKIVYEPTSHPPQSLLLPNDIIMSASPKAGLVDETQDEDGTTRRYYVFNRMIHDPDKWFRSIGIVAAQRYLNYPDTLRPIGDSKSGVVTFGDIRIPTYGNSPTFLINYLGPSSGARMLGGEPWRTFNRYPLSNILDVADVQLTNPEEDSDWMEFFLQDNPLYGALGESPFKNKIVLIGVSVEVVHDTKRTPYFSFAGTEALMPGVEVHANAIQTLLDQNFVSVLGRSLDWTDKSWASHTTLVLALSLLAFLLIATLPPLAAGAAILGEVVVYVSVSVGLFVQDSWWLAKGLLHFVIPSGWFEGADWLAVAPPTMGESILIPVVTPLLGVALTYSGNILYRFIVEQKDKRFLKNTFGTYVSPELIDRMYEERRQPQLGGVAGYHSAFFSDIQSFSSFSEVLPPVRMVALMNEYLTNMTEILLRNKGTLDKYIGDAIVAFWGAPLPVEDHEYLVLFTAIEMEKRLVELRKKWQSEDGWPGIVQNLRHRAGINSGEMVTGNMGSNMRMNYTMMGDPVNIAARLEASAKQYGVYIQVADRTYQAAADRFEWRFLDNVRVKGKKLPVKVYELLALKGELDELHRKVVPVYEEGIDLYQKREWGRALQAFESANQMEDRFPARPTNPSEVYIERCRHFLEHPPVDDWDGVWILTKK